MLNEISKLNVIIIIIIILMIIIIVIITIIIIMIIMMIIIITMRVNCKITRTHIIMVEINVLQ